MNPQPDPTAAPLAAAAAAAATAAELSPALPPTAPAAAAAAATVPEFEQSGFAEASRVEALVTGLGVADVLLLLLPVNCSVQRSSRVSEVGGWVAWAEGWCGPLPLLLLLLEEDPVGEAARKICEGRVGWVSRLALGVQRVGSRVVSQGWRQGFSGLALGLIRNRRRKEQDPRKNETKRVSSQRKHIKPSPRFRRHKRLMPRHGRIKGMTIHHPEWWVYHPDRTSTAQ